ncbi:MAG: family 78 glycoside hydrolase catalytic domain [Anaerolineae bacterium]|nr:family 78 glycoside hydrolase catalytic domain [Anaerolineae bacterium]
MMYHRLTGMRCKYLENPLGIGLEPPFFSWRMESDRTGAAQTAYQLQVTKTDSFDTLIWDIGWVAQGRSDHIVYQGEPLTSMTCYYWRVRVKDENGSVSGWSETARFETGLALQDWSAMWVEPEGEINPKAFQPASYLRKEFESVGVIARARLYVTAHGLYEVYLNGQRVGDQLFTPGNTDVVHRLQYQVYDVTGLLQTGTNCIGTILGDGWYRGAINVASLRNAHGEKVALLVQLVITDVDGMTRIIASDESWKTSTGPIIKSDPKQGEVYDARMEMPGWNTTNFNDDRWRHVHPAEFGYNNLIPSESVPVRKKEMLLPTKILRTPANETVIDFGQNIAGIVQMKVVGPSGTIVTLTHSEVLDKDGNFCLNYFGREVGGPFRQVDVYMLKGDIEEIFVPHFTVHGFRYVKVEGYPGAVTSENFRAFAVYSDMEATGSFACSNEKINQLFRNIQWSMKGNFLDIPTDCPTRERAGWTGDAQIFVHTGSLLMDDAAFYAKWIKDVSSQQYPDGKIRNVVPDKPLSTGKKVESSFNLPPGSSGWGDAVVIIPWTLYQMFGDTTILAQQYESMKKWVDYERCRAEKRHWITKLNPRVWLNPKKNAHQRFIWDTNYHLGEWLEPDMLLKDVWKAVLRNLVLGDPVVATAYYEHSARLLGETAAILGKTEDAAEYLALADNIRDAYIKEFIQTNGTISVYSDKQAPYVRALAFNLYTNALKGKIEKKLVENIEAKNRHLFTGFLSTPFLLSVLSEASETELAYEILLQEENPSWLYAINKGATTIWEDWEGISAEGVPTASQNHYSKGAVASWFFEFICGIQLDPNVPAYKHFFLYPEPGGGITHARAEYRSPYGEIISEWEKLDSGTRYHFQIPPNTTAQVRIRNIQALTQPETAYNFSLTAGCATFDLGSGKYTMVANE